MHKYALFVYVCVYKTLRHTYGFDLFKFFCAKQLHATQVAFKLYCNVRSTVWTIIWQDKHVVLMCVMGAKCLLQNIKSLSML